MSGKVIENTAFFTRLDTRGFYHTIVKPNAVITLELAKENTAAVLELADDIQRPILVDLRKLKSIDKEARDHFSLRGRRRTVNAMALLISSPVSRIVGNFFLGLNRPAVDTRLFTSEEEAARWLKPYVDKAEKLAPLD
jgi:hypothetical protein